MYLQANRLLWEGDNRLDMSKDFWKNLNDFELKLLQKLLDHSELISVCSYRPLSTWTFKQHTPLVVLKQIPHNLSLGSFFIVTLSFF
ncbi:hypothetical protein VP01_1483g8 [Puccinia sorghi]|uniref:Uncharacterized protein n=1 Tax=Puccinia sorghi TaxID=27349 RepID=A0A0L6VJI8_9BASI|nr:hypothetical protein VP01_1483g8 [Puccinia sorghi]